MAGAKESAATVYVVDDDPGVLESVRWLLESVDLSVRTFEDPHAFLAAFDDHKPACLLLDIRMPGMSGLDLQDWLQEVGATVPVVFLTAHGDVPLAVRAMKSGALEFIEKPYNAHQLIETVQHAIDIHRQQQVAGAWRDRLRRRMERLTPREWEVARLVVDGLSSKAIAAKLGLSPKTVEVHRGRVMTKMGAKSSPELVQMIYEAGSDVLNGSS
ncbi:response regulator transcription factor [Thiohalorhabdus sp.]|uniref:response regulator transcription factor n=1 Tax=Thiohalorhabdus sp. TaxID=3094134 RepID=UPI002FC347FE